MHKKRRGLALILVMMCTGMLAMLVGAFFQANRDSLTLGSAGIRRAEAQMAADSGLTYARFKLERDQSWGKSGFTGYPEVLGPLRVEVDGTGLKGTLADGRSFHLEVTNLLDLAATATQPKDSVLVRVHGTSGGFRVGMEELLVGEPLYDSAVSSNGILNMRGNKSWEIHSRDQIRNWVRSNEAIYANDVFSPTNTTRFISDVGSRVPGVMWSKKDVYAENALVDASNIAAFNQQVAGVAAPRSTMNNNIYDLKITDLKVPTSTVASMPPGRYVLTEAEAIPVNEETRGIWPFRHTVQVDQPPQAIKAVAFYPDGGGSPQMFYPQSELDRVGGSGSPPVHPPASGTLATGSVVQFHPGIPFTFDFSTNDFSISGDQQFQVNGNFAIGYEPPPNGPKLPIQMADIVFSSATDTTFMNVTGSFTVDGRVKGRGAVAAGGEVMMKADADLTASTTDPLVFWSGGNVTIDASGKSDVKFTGLVYAKNDFIVQSSTPVNEVRLTGALVARNGKVSITAADKVNMTYDPAYLQALTHGLPNNRRRLKSINWRQI